jgi:NTE family protein
MPDPVTRIQQVEKLGKLNIVNVIMQSIYISSYFLVESCLKEADIVIEPQVAQIGSVDFRRTQECILRGEWATQDVIPEIKKRLEA